MGHCLEIPSRKRDLWLWLCHGTFALFGAFAVHGPPSRSVEVALLLDVSGSIGDRLFQYELEFVKRMAKFLDVPSSSLVAVITYGTTAQVDINFDSNRTSKEFDKLVDGIPYRGGSTMIDAALNIAADQLFGNTTNTTTAKVTVLLTDGKQGGTSIDLRSVSQHLRNRGVRILAVGIGTRVDPAQLRQIVSSDDDVFLVASFYALPDEVEAIGNRTCNITGPHPTPTGTLLQPSSTVSAVMPSMQDSRVRPRSMRVCHTTNVTGSSLGAWNVTSHVNPVDEFFMKLRSLDIQNRSSIKTAVQITQEVLTILENRQGKQRDHGSDIMCMAQSLEKFAIRFAERQLHDDCTKIQIDNDKIVFQAEFVPKGALEGFVFPSLNTGLYGAMVEVPKENFKTEGCLVVATLYKNLHQSMSPVNNKGSYEKVASKILSISLKPRARWHRLLENVTLRFMDIKGKDQIIGKRLCVFWDFLRRSSWTGSWSTQGCTTSRPDDVMTECSCNHLTHFGILMQVKNQEISSTDQVVLSVITYIGIGISLLGCALTLLLYGAFVNLRTQLTQIRLNLVISIAISQLIFVTGIDATSNMAGCVCVAALIQYFYLVAFCWMLVEGIHLYLCVVKVFNVEHGMIGYYIFAWGFPGMLVIITVGAALNSEQGAAGYLHQQFCWLSFKNNLAWTFVGPVLAITLINIVFLVYVIREMNKMDDVIGSTANQQLGTIRTTAKACLILFPLLGVTWLFGMLTLTNIGVAAQYIFTILNSTQGFSIFLLNCIRNTEIRSKLDAKLLSLAGPWSSRPKCVTPEPTTPRDVHKSLDHPGRHGNWCK